MEGGENPCSAMIGFFQNMLINLIAFSERLENLLRIQNIFLELYYNLIVSPLRKLPLLFYMNQSQQSHIAIIYHNPPEESSFCIDHRKLSPEWNSWI